MMNKDQFYQMILSKPLLCDGGTGTLFQAQSIDVKKDLLGHANCFEILNLTREDIVRFIHQQYLEVGADCIETNSFGANAVVLHEFGLADRVEEINEKAARIARQIADEYSRTEQPRFVIGSMGPGTKLPSLGQIDYDTLYDSYFQQACGLLSGGVDCLLLETNQDLLTIKAEIAAGKAARAKFKKDIPIFTQVTMDVTGQMLVGATIETVVTVLSAMDIEGIGLNCGLGPIEMAAHVAYLSKHWSGFISVMPNAGLPVMVDGKSAYLLTPEELAHWQKRFIEELGVNFIGGCCGTTPAHIAALRKMLDGKPKRATRNPVIIPAATSLYQSIPFKQENAIFSIGERANASGSKQFRELLLANDWDGMVEVAKSQVDEGSSAIDISVSAVGRDEKADMVEMISRCRGQVRAPIVIDSTQPEVIEAALKLLGSKAIINSINLEGGEKKARKILTLAKKFGAAVVALTIDEEGMAKTLERKVEIAKRLYQLAVNAFQLPAHDLFFDPLTFTICTGMPEDREHGIVTLNAIEEIKQACPGSQLLLGLSNISFGLKPAARQVLNSVYLSEAKKRNLDAAIIHLAKIKPLFDIPDEQRQAANALIYSSSETALLNFIKLFDHESAVQKSTVVQSIEEKLNAHIIKGSKLNLETDINEALKKYQPIEILNQLLLPAMQEVGELFARGETQLPFVLQSAETMKAAVKLIEPKMKATDQSSKGTLLLATVQGDVHDIGKNLVEIILSNNGYRVIDIGINQSIDDIIAAIKKYKPDVLGLSGLLVQSTLIMKENLSALKSAGITIPVILGGAALTKQFVTQECAAAYAPYDVYYAKDVFGGLKTIKEMM